MSRRNPWIAIVICALAVTYGCGRSSSPVAPAPAASGSGDAAADGSTLKVTAPVPQSPVNNQQPEGALQFVANASSFRFGGTGALVYRFEIYNAANTKVCDSGLIAGGPATVVWAGSGCALVFDAPHRWRVRAEQGTFVGPWSADANFRAPAGAYIRGNELFDPLTNGRSSIISNSNDVTFLPGVGVRLNSPDSYVEWRLAASCVECEFSAMMTNIGNGSEEFKPKVMSMLQADGTDTTLNPYRVTIDKRSTWLGQGSRIRYTMRSRGIEPAAEAAGGPQTWNRALFYFWKFEWRANLARLTVFENGKNGRQMENLPHSYPGPYAPNPHLIRLGSVGGRAANETNPGTIVFNVWVSPNPRPNLPGDR